MDIAIVQVLAEFLGFEWNFHPKSGATDARGRLASELAVNAGEAEIGIGHVVVTDMRTLFNLSRTAL